MLIGPKTYGGIGLINTLYFFITEIILSLIAFTYLTSKAFVNKCQKMRQEDNIEIND